MAKLVTEEPARPQEIVTVQVPVELPPEPERATMEDMGEALAILGEIIEQQSQTLPAEPEEPEEPETPEEPEGTIVPEENLSALPPAPEIQSDVPPPKNTPPETPRSHGRNGLRRMIFGE